MRSLGSIAVLAVLLLTGCSASGGDAMTSDGGTAGSYTESSESAYDGADMEATDEAGDTPGDGARDRQVITSGWVSMTVTDPRDAAEEIARLVEHVGGFVQERHESSERDGREASASLAVRIPADEVTSTLARLEELGDVDDVEISSDDVTAQAQDLDARIRALQISVGRLEGLLERSGSVSQVVEAEQVLTSRQAELESLQSRRAHLAEQVAMSTLRVELGTTRVVAVEPASGFLSGLATGWNGLVSAFMALATLTGVLLPWLVVAGVILLVVLAARRRPGRRQVATAPSVAHTPAVGAEAPAPTAPPAPGGPPAPGAPPASGPPPER